MNIQTAKEQVINSVKSYLVKDKFGNYLIPSERQRPVFLMGPPGVGKTAIMEQVAEELSVALITYSMTHHTRQSAIGLPFIATKNYGGTEYKVSEYTMSEIIASVYEVIENTGMKEGILFLDEINCVSETLAPAMLQFLQYKIFGMHKLPEGWIVVTAGNPPEYNSSVREFDVVTWDRLKRVDIEPDYMAWKNYATATGMHPAITTYLDLKKDHFYKIETVVGDKKFVTARGWEDLSRMMYVYEDSKITVDESLIRQYVQDAEIAKNFAVYYDLFNKYKKDYQADKIIAGTYDDKVVARAKKAKFDERLSLIGLLNSKVSGIIKDVIIKEVTYVKLAEIIKSIRNDMLTSKKKKPVDIVKTKIDYINGIIKSGTEANNISYETKTMYLEILDFLNSYMIVAEDAESAMADAVFEKIRKNFKKTVTELDKEKVGALKAITNFINFGDKAFESGQEMVVILTELTSNKYISKFLSENECKAYLSHNKSLHFTERQLEIEKAIIMLDDME